MAIKIPKLLKLCSLLFFSATAYGKPGTLLTHQEADSPVHIAADVDELKVGAFNIEVFGVSKMTNPETVDILVQIIRRYDIIFLQEIRDKSGRSLEELLEKVNYKRRHRYNAVVSDRLGRTDQKEQYAYIFSTAKLKYLDSFHYDDGNDPYTDVFAREPLAVRFETYTGFDFGMIGVHIATRDAKNELSKLGDVYKSAKNKWQLDQLIMMGDLNAGCDFLRPSQLEDLDLWYDEYYYWPLGNNIDSTVTHTHCPYDQFVIPEGMVDYVVEDSAKVYRFDHELSLTPTQALEVSDHYPIELMLKF